MTLHTADLHVHTFYSDGTESPECVIALAKDAGLSAIGIADHDNTDAYSLGLAAAQRAQIELIPAIEMSASYEGLEVHVLGYFFDGQHPALRRHIEEQQERRIARVHEMVGRLKPLGVIIEAAEVLQLAGPGTVGRPHLARILAKHGYVSSPSDAFKQYIGDGCPGFVPGSPVLPQRVIHLIREAGGIPVLAHPIFLKRDELIEQFMRDGLLGLEVYHSSHAAEDVRRYEVMAKQLGLLMTGGTDYHGDSKEGAPIGSVKVPYALVESLKAAHARMSRGGAPESMPGGA